MSAVQGKKREQKNFEKSVGIFESNVIAVNPNREELEKLLNTELEKDPEYLGEDKDGDTKLNLSVWLEEVKTKQLFNVRFFLKDQVRANKDETKYQYINNVGNTAWADDPENLPSWFLKDDRPYRKAKAGEEEMYRFIQSWMPLDTRLEETKFDFDFSKLMRGNVSELREVIGNHDLTDTIVALATIRTSEDGQTDYQQVYNRNFLPGWTMKHFNLGGKKIPKLVQKFIDNVEDPEYGCKEFYGSTLGPLHTYNPEENIATSDNSAISEDGPDLD